MNMLILLYTASSMLVQWYTDVYLGRWTSNLIGEVGRSDGIEIVPLKNVLMIYAAHFKLLSHCPTAPSSNKYRISEFLDCDGRRLTIPRKPMATPGPIFANRGRTFLRADIMHHKSYCRWRTCRSQPIGNIA